MIVPQFWSLWGGILKLQVEIVYLKEVCHWCLLNVSAHWWYARQGHCRRYPLWIHERHRNAATSPRNGPSPESNGSTQPRSVTRSTGFGLHTVVSIFCIGYFNYDCQRTCPRKIESSRFLFPIQMSPSLHQHNFMIYKVNFVNKI